MWRATTPAGLFPEWVGGAVDPFDLDGRVEGFRGGIIETDTGASHRPADPEFARVFSERRRLVLNHC